MGALPANFRRSALSNYATTTSSIILALLTVPLLTGGLGVEAYGIWVLVGATVLYLELLDFGFGSTTVKYVAAARGQDDDAAVRTAVATSFWLLALPGALALLAGLAMAAGFPYVFDISPSLTEATRILLLMLAVDLAISLPSDCFGAVLIAYQRFDLLNATLIAVSVAQAAAWAVVLAAGGGLVSVGVVTVVLSLIGQLARYLLARRLIPGLSLNPRHVSRELIRPYAGTSTWFALSEMSSVVISRIDTIVVGIVVSVPAAGVYAVGQKLALLVQRTIRPAINAFFPHAADLYARGDREGLRDAAASGIRIATGVGLPLALVVGLFAGPLIDIWVGERFADAAMVVVYLSAATAVTALAEAPRLLLYGGSGVRGVALIRSAEAGGNLVLSIVLGQVMGLQGVALATLISACITVLAGLVPYACRLLDLRQREVYGRLLRSHGLPVVATTVVAALLLRLDPAGAAAVLGSSALSGVVYLLLLARTGLTSAEREVLWRRLRRRSADA